MLMSQMEHVLLSRDHHLTIRRAKVNLRCCRPLFERAVLFAAVAD